MKPTSETQIKSTNQEATPGTQISNCLLCTSPLLCCCIYLLQVRSGLPRSPLQPAWPTTAVRLRTLARCGCLPAAVRHTVEWWPAALVGQTSDWLARPNLCHCSAHPPNISWGKSLQPAHVTFLGTQHAHVLAAANRSVLQRMQQDASLMQLVCSASHRTAPKLAAA